MNALICRQLTQTSKLAAPRVSVTGVSRVQIQRRRVGEVASSGGKFAEREKAFENQYFRQKDAEAMKKLRDGVGKEAEEASPAKEEKKPQGQAQPSQGISARELLDFRKDILERIRRLEDEVHELRYLLSK
eukprot:TRINITY_DN157_c0_g1_i1.p2 TRINITY_DN157_c0_g1~~TRINITY_DN157_c0_g1_i1.p2  ORF type:complete len:131 (+),score=59.43 TRINITY_DN157_c0_g1_i1:189-581(+)